MFTCHGVATPTLQSGKMQGQHTHLFSKQVTEVRR
jgi:hypothetical protein